MLYHWRDGYNTNNTPYRVNAISKELVLKALPLRLHNLANQGDRRRRRKRPLNMKEKGELMLEIRPAKKEEFINVWPIIHGAFKKGDTYAFSPDTTIEEGFNIWMEAPKATYIAISAGKITGTYYIKANQPGLGAHVCNAGYIVDAASRGQGIGRAMCEHSLCEARKMGFKAMQYNLVVTTNIKAIKIWVSCGFKIIGTLPKAFNHAEEGLVDAIIMYQWLDN